jgi:CheY-like chemotaxis protein
LAKILIVDDSSFQRRMIRNLLCSLGHEVVEAADGAARVEMAKRDPSLDILFLDLLMPVLDGFGALEQLRDLSCPIPRVVLTADVQEKSRQRRTELGAVAVLSKPPRQESLREVIEAHARAAVVSL